MSGAIEETLGDLYRPFDLVIYTSAIEHMQPADQQASLVEAAKVSRKGAVLYLSCPVTQPGRSGYDAQYAAHVYEPNDDELRAWLKAAGWRVKRRIGLVTKVTAMKERLSSKELRAANYIKKIMPREQALPTIAAMYPACAEEVAYVCERSV
jgi:2-polyprenyl-3-methyl-5-hydroxy-6-metoxy-1,4-benzoquinol methylase